MSYYKNDHDLLQTELSSEILHAFESYEAEFLSVFSAEWEDIRNLLRWKKNWDTRHNKQRRKPDQNKKKKNRA